MKSTDVNVTQLRADLPSFLKRVQNGEPLRITSRGRVIARLLPPADTVADARKLLSSWRDATRIGDVVSPVETTWDAEH